MNATARPPRRRSQGPGRPKDPGKRAAILQAAKQLFPQHGFDKVSMDQIAAEAGVSKLTVYSHFQDKETLFVEAVRHKCLEQLPEASFAPALSGPIRERLLAIGQQFYALVSSDDAVGLQRMILADPRNAPRLGRMFWEAGPQRIIENFQAMLERAVVAGQLDIPDTREAAGQFLCLLKGEVNMRMLCGPDACSHGDDTAAHVASVVDFFLRAYGRR